jgi:LAO/AO transport system kinase
MDDEIPMKPASTLAQLEEDPELWARAVANGHLLAASRLMRYLDDRIPVAINVMKALFHQTGKAHIIGVTGSPGTGKSTLVDQLVAEARKREKTVGVVAVDPSSPFTEGAILGDRIRMKRHNVDPGVFIRSLATRGQLGGLSRSTHDIVDVMDAMGKDLVIVETVGVGQDEMDIVKLAHTNIIVQVPGMGDDVQAIKAGILEVGDIFVVNKSDLVGADRAVQDLEMMIHFKDQSSSDYTPPVIKAEANTGTGIGDLMDCVERHGQFIRGRNGAMIEKSRLRTRFQEILRQSLFEQTQDRLKKTNLGKNLMEKVENRLIDPYSAAEEVLSAKLY